MKHFTPQPDRCSPVARRLAAVQLIHDGLPAARVASLLGVTPQSVRTWVRAESRGGAVALRTCSRSGRRPRIGLGSIASSLAGPNPHYHKRLWTVAEFSSHLELRFGVRYHPSHTWRIMTALGLTLRPRKAGYGSKMGGQVTGGAPQCVDGVAYSTTARLTSAPPRELEGEAIHILREAAGQCERPVLLFSGGKDSITVAWLARKAFAPAAPPMPLLHVDTGDRKSVV